LLITGSTKGVDLSDLSVNNSVIFTGFVEDIRSVVAAAWMAVVPILSGGGTRIKILEAMALGTPVVATSKAAEGLTVRDGEHILLADDPATFADCTLRLLRDPFLRRRLVTNARRLVEQHYDWAQICQYFVDLVEDITSRRVFRDLL
jgi:glycosyltransferase involved in cell wall biosynthesis